MFVLEILLTGLCIALVPLTYIWVKGDADKFRKLVWVTTFFTLDLVMFGGFTRLTDSGLGCPDWPGCYGTASPFIAHGAIHAAQALMPTGPVTMTKAWIEMIHRYFATAIGVLVTMQVVLAWFKRRTLRVSPWWPTALLGLIVLQGVFGAWTVTLRLQPIIVTTHLLLGLALLGALGWVAARLTPTPLPAPSSLRWQPAALIGLVMLINQLALGGWVSTNYAVLACTDFPTCNGAWVPPMDFAQGFHLWRQLGLTSGGEALTQDALVAIHWVHRTFAFLVVPYLAWLGWCLRRDPALRAPALGLLGVILLQFVTGVSNIVLQWPLAIAVAHNGGAAVLLLLLVMLNYRLTLSRSATLTEASATAPAVGA